MKNNYFLKAVFTFLLCGFFTMSYGADWYISATGNDTSGDGSMALPWASFSKAQTAAGSGDVIYVSGMIDMWSDPGNTTFTALASGSSTTNKTGIVIAKSLTIQGTSSATDGFNGTSGGNTTRFFTLSAAYTLSIKNLKLANGAIISTQTTLAYAGGAILMTNGNIMAENVIFDNNVVSGHTGITGAAIAVNGTSNAGTYFKNCVFSNNKADKAGAVYIQTWAAGTSIVPSIFQFENCSFVANEAKNTGGSALFVRSASDYTTFNTINCTFSKNKVVTASNGGTINMGGKGMRYMNMNIINCTVSENTTAGSSGNGAGLNYVNTANNNIGNLYIKNTIIENNKTTLGAFSDLNVNAASPTVPETGLSGTPPAGTPGYIKIENSFIGAHISDITRVPAGNIISSNVGYLTATSTTNDLKAGLAPFNTTNNFYPLYFGSLAIGYGNSSLLTPYSITDQLGNVRTVGATNYAGAWESTLIPIIPKAPTALDATATSTKISVAFTEGSNGGSSITNYKYSIDGGVTFIPCDPVQTISPIMISGLENGTAYTVILKAVNAVGDGVASDPSNSVTPSPFTGLNNELSSSIAVVKNSNNQIVIKNTTSKSGLVTICNALGQRILSTNLNGTSTTIDKTFNSGVYMILVNIEGKTASTKIIL